MVIFDFSLLAFGAGLLGAGLACAIFIYGIPAVRRMRAKVKSRRAKKIADEKLRWQLLKPLFLAGVITEFAFQLKGWSDGRPFIRLKGPEFEARCDCCWGTRIRVGDENLWETVSDALGTPGTDLGGMRRVARILVQAIRLDEDVPVLYDSVGKHMGYIKSMRSDKVTKFRKLA